MEAAGGYGKSVLAAELVELWGALGIWVLLDEAEISARLLVARLRDAVSRAGLSDAAALMTARGDDPGGAVDALLTALDGEMCAIVVDDAHNADRSAARLLCRIAAQRPESVRLAVLARRLPAGAERLRRADVFQVSSRELALRPEETVSLCRNGFGLDVSDDEAQRLDQATGGWTAAAVLAAARASRTGTTLGAVTNSASSQRDVLAVMLEEALAALGSDRALLAQIAIPPLLDAELVTAVTGADGLFDGLLACGLPLSAVRDGWLELPGPVRDYLSGLAGPDPAALRKAAGVYSRRGELATALRMLLAAADWEAVMRLLEDWPAGLPEAIDALELVAMLDMVPPAVQDRFPGALLNCALVFGAATMVERYDAAIDRVASLVDDRTAPELRRRLEAEQAASAFNHREFAFAQRTATEVLSHAGSTEQLTRARALTTLALTTGRRRDPDGRLSEGCLEEAAGYIRQAAQLHLGLGNSGAAAGVLIYKVAVVDIGLGRADLAVEDANRALALCSEFPRRFAHALFWRAQARAELGLEDEAQGDLAEVWSLASSLGHQTLRAYAEWQRMICASYRGDAGATQRHAQLAEVERGDWWSVAGAHFLADAADCLDRVGATEVAVDYLERARLDPQDAERVIAMAECALLARHGDPADAEDRLDGVHAHGIQPREQWRVTLLRAYAAFRRGSDQAGPTAAHAFEQAARLGQPQLPLIRERALTEALLGLAVETGKAAAVALDAASLPTAVSVLGRFELASGGRPVPLAAGQGAQLLKLVAVAEGRVPVERAIEALWPGGDPSSGRNRLRVVLSRLRNVAGDVIVREGDLLTLGPEVRLDLVDFHDEARRALALRGGNPAAAVAVARSAIARYRGPLLPHDPYEPWAEGPREQASRTMLDLLDLCADIATDRGDLDETRRVVERTIELAPYDDERYLRVAMILQRQGRKGAALSVLRRARSALAQLDVDPPRALVELERMIATSDRVRASV